MSETLSRSSGSWAWLIVGGLALGGYFIGVAPAERKMQEIRAQAHDLYDLAIRNEHLLRGATGLSAARERVAIDVARLAGQRGAGSATLRTLQMLQREGSLAHVTIGGLSPDAPDSGAQNGSEDVTIAMRGTYRNVLSAIADVSRHDVLARGFGRDARNGRRRRG